MVLRMLQELHDAQPRSRPAGGGRRRRQQHCTPAAHRPAAEAAALTPSAPAPGASASHESGPGPGLQRRLHPQCDVSPYSPHQQLGPAADERGAHGSPLSALPRSALLRGALAGLVACPCCVRAAAANETTWGYGDADGPREWGGACAAGARQSPVDLPAAAPPGAAQQLGESQQLGQDCRETASAHKPAGSTTEALARCKAPACPACARRTHAYTAELSKPLELIT